MPGEPLTLEPHRLSMATRIACLVVRADAELLSLAPMRDRLTIMGEAMLLTIVASISGLAWGTFWAQFSPLSFAIGFGITASALILFIDQAIGFADWRLHGVLRQPGIRIGWRYGSRLTARFAMTAIFSMATSTGACMAMFHDTISDQLDRTRREQNQAIEDRYAKQEDKLRYERYGALLTAVGELRTSVKETTPKLDAAIQGHADAANRFEAARLEAEREKSGAPGYQKGPGRHYRTALDEQRRATAALVKADADLAIYRPRLEAAQQKLGDAEAQLKAAEASVHPDIARLEVEKQMHLVPARQDALLSYLALQEVFRSPVYGAAARYFSHMMMAVLMTIEVSYFVVRIWFAPASVYTTLLIADTKFRAQKGAAYHQRESETLWRAVGNSAPPPLRFLREQSPAANDESEKRKRKPSQPRLPDVAD